MGTLAAGIKEIFATAKTTGSNVMLCGNDGTPDGHMTMANLASALGVEKTAIPVKNLDDETVTVTDMNTFYPPTVGCWAYVANGAKSNSAFGSWQWGFCFNLNGDRVAQVTFNAISNSAPKSRIKDPSTGVWSDWVDI